MINLEIINFLAKEMAHRNYHKTMARYFLILNNYLKNRPLSLIEASNHQNHSPRWFYLKLLAEGFALSIDPNSPLFENRLDQEREGLTWTDDSSFYRRFFNRLKFFRENNKTISEDSLKDMISMGYLLFNQKYEYNDQNF